MAKKAVSKVQPLLEGIRRWQGYWNYTDQYMANAFHISRITWLRWKSGETEISHRTAIEVINFLKIPHDDAVNMLSAGLKI